MIIIIFWYEQYFGSQNRIKVVHAICWKFWKTLSFQKNEKIFVNMSQIDNLSLWIENTCFKTSFKTSSFSRKNMSSKNIFQIFIFLWLPQSKSGTPKNCKSWLPQSGPGTPKNWKNGTPNKPLGTPKNKTVAPPMVSPKKKHVLRSAFASYSLRFVATPIWCKIAQTIWRRLGATARLERK